MAISGYFQLENIRNFTFIENEAELNGGGLYFDSIPLTLENKNEFPYFLEEMRFIRNFAQKEGGAIFISCNFDVSQAS
jgi:predicted outer membrane repeat protein